MSITLQLAPALEASLRDEAAREGVDTGTLVLRTLERQFGQSASHPPASNPSASPLNVSPESTLLLRINDGPSEAIWRRYHELSAKRNAESLTPAEHQELIVLSEAIETADVQRLEYMAELANLRGVSLRELRAQLGISQSQHTGGQSIG